jgi:hypothetical protein
LKKQKEAFLQNIDQFFPRQFLNLLEGHSTILCVPVLDSLIREVNNAEKELENVRGKY